MAGLQEAFRNAAAAAFAAVGNLKESAVLRSKNSANPAYDPTTDAVTDSYTDYTVDTLPSGYNSREADGKTVLMTDEKLKILVSSLSVSPKRNDQVIRSNTGSAVKWEVINVHKDPADAMWTLQVRRP